MKRVIIIAAALALIPALAGCASSGGSTSYTDGVYSAEDAEFGSSGWKENVTITVAGGSITEVDWNGASSDETLPDKKTYSEEGGYAMVATGGASAEWHEQAEVMEAELIRTQDPAKIAMDDEGYADGISGATIHVSGFVELAEQALSEAK